MEKISVIITTKDREKELHRAIRSVRSQSYKNIEIIVVDDGSDPDLYKRVVDCYSSGNIKFVRNTSSLGACSARNSGISASTGSFISGLDDDDEFTEDRLEKLMIFHSSFDIEPSLVCSYNKNYNPSSGLVTFEKEYDINIDLESMKYSNKVGSQVLIRKEKLLGAGLFDEEFVASQDYDMWFRVIAMYGDAKKINEFLYICHDDPSLTRVSSNKKKGMVQFYTKHRHSLKLRHKIYSLARFLRALIK
ncbi:glycosyltransferase [Vibrio sp. 10N.237.312.B06]|uniref:glycosyltransferase n=1 Tax=Vibrio sp. 10N.237.312.B06 TaxID=3229974 RepID=UPI003550891F